MRGALVALLLLVALACVPAQAAQVCLHGSFSLTSAQSAPDTTYCNQTLCSAAVDIVFDPDTIAQGNWPLSVQFADLTYLSSLFPTLTAVNFSCDASGNIVASTATVANTAERLRLVWTYSSATAALSTNCAFNLQSVDWTADYVSTQVLFSYSGSGDIVAYDALAISTTASLGAMQHQCAAPPVDTTTTSTTTTDTTTTSTTGTFGDCRYPAYVWTHERSHSAEWLAVADLRVCTVPYRNLVFGNGQANSLMPGIKRLSQAVAVVTLDGLMYGLTQDEIAAQVPKFGEALAIVNRAVNCASGADYSELSQVLEVFSNNMASCVGGDVFATATNGSCGCSHSKQQGYLAWAIVMTVMTFVFLVMLVVLVVAWFFEHRNHNMRIGGGAGGYAIPGQRQFGF